MKKTILIICLMFFQSYIISADFTTQETKIKAEKKISAEINVNRKFLNIKSDILKLSYKEQIDLALSLLRKLIIISGYKDPDLKQPVHTILRDIDSLIGVMVRFEQKDFIKSLKDYKKDPEAIGKDILSLSSEVLAFKQIANEIREDIFKTYYEIIYKNIKENDENISPEDRNYLDQNFPNGKMISPKKLKNILKSSE